MMTNATLASPERAMPSFADFNLHPDIARAIDELGFEEPSPVQTQAIPILLEGRDLIAQAMTGTGKTAAFGIPLAQHLDPDSDAIQAVVLAPTRELAVQVAEQVYRLGRHRGLRVLPIYGGQPIERQLRALRGGVQIVVATPGRLMDHMRRGSIDFGRVRVAVLDEADEMLAMGFLEDIELILGALPEARQTALFSATIPDPIRALAQRYLRDPATVTLAEPRGVSIPAIRQRYVEVPGRYKFEALVRFLDVEQPRSSIVFCGTKRAVDEVAEGLRSRGYRVEALHGDMSQVMRDRAVRALREGRADVLVATDVAARGLDIEQVSHVINFDVPNDPEYYVHRIGRTGRAGRAGEALTFVAPWEMREFRLIERVVGGRIERASIPTAAEIEERERGLLAERILTTLERGQWGRYRIVVEELADDHDLTDIAAAALTLAEQARLGERPRDGTTSEELEEWLRRPPRPPMQRPARQFRGPPPGRRSGPPPGRWGPPPERRPAPSGPRRYRQQPRQP
jgi:ATP-dependent RNA helicase DeaD